jgi:alcohol dehydrogenase YqhD (iron-dependent ADH family)
MNFEFFYPTYLIFGNGSRFLPGAAVSCQSKRVLVFTGGITMNFKGKLCKRLF